MGLTAPHQPQHTSHQRPVDILRWEGISTFPTTTTTSRQSYFQSAEDPQAGQAQIISQMGLAGEQELWSTGIMRTEPSPPRHPLQTLLSQPKTLLGSKQAEKSRYNVPSLDFHP